MSRPPLTRTAVWMRERACVPLVRVEAWAVSATAPVAQLATARRGTRRRTRRAA
ncbi:hypothetical protein [Leifsonia sp. EB34]|uniref:hypothetical protein n=1 Tax=Leifsonia sp. EB34 TaxID=3156303 RepID=UPI003514AB22